MPVADGHTTDGWMDEWMDRTKFIGPLSALPGVQKATIKNLSENEQQRIVEYRKRHYEMGTN